jgi:hypothetical protein
MIEKAIHAIAWNDSLLRLKEAAEEEERRNHEST